MADCAPDFAVENAVKAFIRAKELSVFPYAAKAVEQLLDDSGLREDPELLYSLEEVYLRYQIFKAEQNRGR